jgi:hypothetical protein
MSNDFHLDQGNEDEYDLGQSKNVSSRGSSTMSVSLICASFLDAFLFMDFLHHEGPLGDYLEELNEPVEKTPVLQLIKEQIEAQDFVNPTAIEKELVHQTALRKGFYHLQIHQKQDWKGVIKPIIALGISLTHWIVGFIMVLTFFWKYGQQWAYNYKFGLEFNDWRRKTRKLDQLIQKSLLWIKESEIVSRGYRLTPQMTPIEHLEQQIQFQTSVELRRMVYYALKEQLTYFHRLEFTNAEYSMKLQERLQSPSLSEDSEDPLSLQCLKGMYRQLIDTRLCTLHFWNLNWKLPNITLKYGSILHIRTLNKKTKSLCQALQVTFTTQQSL